MIPKLDFTDAKLFYDLWIPLLDHVNRTYNVNPKLGKMARADGLNIQEVRVVADFLWSHPAVIDGYLASAELPPDHREILAGWSRFVSGEFILERHLKRGSVFISLEGLSGERHLFKLGRNDPTPRSPHPSAGDTHSLQG